MPKAVVTGGAGFVGSSLVRLLARNGWQVLVYDALKPGKLEFLPQESPAIELVVGNLLDEAQLTQTMQEFAPDVVFHLAAIHYIPYCNAHPLETLRVNVEGTEAVLRACRVASVPRIVFTSTAAVYPSVDEPISETVPAQPLDIYGYTKYFGEQLIDWHQRQSGATCVIARLFNVYGPRETSPHLIPEILDQLIGGTSELQLGNLDPKRDYVYVDDVARSLYELAILEVGQQHEPLRVNVGTGREYSAHEVVAALQRITERPVTITQDPRRMRASDRPHLCADNSKLRSLIGWAPDTDFAEGLAGLLSWTQQRAESVPA